MRYRAVECPNMMGGRGFRVEELKSRTFVFQFLALMHMMPNHILVHEMSLIPSILTILYYVDCSDNAWLWSRWSTDWTTDAWLQFTRCRGRVTYYFYSLHTAPSMHGPWFPRYSPCDVVMCYRMTTLTKQENPRIQQTTGLSWNSIRSPPPTTKLGHSVCLHFPWLWGSPS